MSKACIQCRKEKKYNWIKTNVNESKLIIHNSTFGNFESTSKISVKIYLFFETTVLEKQTKNNNKNK